MQTSARPRTLVLVMSDVVIEAAMLGPRGNELGERQLVPITTETATLWRAIDALGEFDRITMIGTDSRGLAARIANQSQRPVRHMTHGDFHWRHRIAGRGVELALVLEPRLRSCLFHDGIEIPGLDIGWQRARKDKRYREYLAPRVLERRGEKTWLRRVSRVVDDLLAIYNPSVLYLATSPALPLPADLPAAVQVVPLVESLDGALRVHAATSTAGTAPAATPASSSFP